MAALQSLSTAITILALVLTITSVVMPRWMKNDPKDTINDNTRKISGLWIRCTMLMTGNWNCDDYDRLILGLTTKMQFGRILGAGSIFFGFLGFVLTTFGMECVPVGGVKSSKSKLRVVGGCLTIISGGMLLAISSWFANDIAIQHNIASNGNNSLNISRTIFGEALFIAWAASILSFVGGCCALCTSCSNSDDDDFNQTRGYIYRPPPIKTSNVASQEYV